MKEHKMRVYSINNTLVLNPRYYYQGRKMFVTGKSFSIMVMTNIYYGRKNKQLLHWIWKSWGKRIMADRRSGNGEWA